MGEGALNWEVKSEEGLVRWPHEERAPFRTERHVLHHGGTRKNGVLRSTKQFSMAGVGVPGGECQAWSARELERKNEVSLLSPIVPAEVLELYHVEQ